MASIERLDFQILLSKKEYQVHSFFYKQLVYKHQYSAEDFQKQPCIILQFGVHALAKEGGCHKRACVLNATIY